MKRILALILGLSLSFPIFASTEVFEIGEVKFTLTQKRCENKTILDLATMLGLKSELRPKLKAGLVEDLADGVQPMCYVAHPEDPNTLYVIDVLGNAGVVPKKL